MLDQALLSYPNSLELLRIRGKIHLTDNDPQTAVEVLQKALRLDRHDYICRYQLSQAYEKLGRKAEAEEHKRILDQTQKDIAELSRLNREVLNSPWDVPKRLRLVELCEKLDKPDLAAIWRKAAAARPAPPAEPTKGAGSNSLPRSMRGS
jgi:tetratricopeptide (TPR) repeat protein